MKKDTRLYNVMFPIWFLLLFPSLWVVMLPVNFIADSLVILLSARHQGLEDRKSLWKTSILPVWLIGFLCDIAGAGLTVLLYYLQSELNVPFPNPILFPGTCLISRPGVILSGVLIYFVNKRFSFKKSGLDADAVRRLCLHLAIFTAPYTMLIPLYG